MPKQDDSNWGKLGGLALEVAVAVALGAFAGQWWDKKHHSEPWGILIGTGLGFVVGMYPLIREGFRENKN
jgi:F0F1-type ATP synthase assembly protein I